MRGGKKRKETWLDCDLFSQRQAPCYKQPFDINLISFTSLLRIKTVKASANKCMSPFLPPSVFFLPLPLSSSAACCHFPWSFFLLSSHFHYACLCLSLSASVSISSALLFLFKYHNHWWGKSAGISTRGLEEPFCVSLINVSLYLSLFFFFLLHELYRLFPVIEANL